jgi:membrane-bound lytic murein transglycosylase B
MARPRPRLKPPPPPRRRSISPRCRSRSRPLRADTAKRYGLKPEQISSVLDQAQVRQPIIAAMSRPAERVKPWNEYRPMFISKARIDGGRAFLASTAPNWIACSSAPACRPK